MEQLNRLSLVTVLVLSSANVVSAEEPTPTISRAKPSATSNETPPAASAPAPSGGGDVLEDDILSPAPSATEPATTKTVHRIGFVPLVPLSADVKALASEASQKVSLEISESELLAVEPLTAIVDDEEKRPYDKTAGQKNAKAGEQALSRAHRLLERVLLKKAESQFKKAIASFESASAGLESTDSFVKAYIGLGEVYARQGFEEETVTALRHAARINPEFVLDEGKYPPLFLRTFAKARSDVWKGPKGKILVDGSARGAKVFINGKEIGAAPVVITGVPVGKHLVRVFAEGVGLFGETVEVLPDAQIAVAPGFYDAARRGPLDLLAQNRFDDDAARKVAKSAQAAVLEGAIVGVVAKRRSSVRVALLYVDANTAFVHSIEELSFDLDLLNVSIEALKAREAVASAVEKKQFGPVPSSDLLADAKASGEVTIPEVGLRYDAAAFVEKEQPRKARTPKGDSSTTLEGEGNEGRRVVDSGSKGKRQTLKSGSTTDPLKRKDRATALTEADDEPGLLSSTMTWVLIGGGVAAVGALLVVGGAAGATGYYFFAPPSSGQATLILPGE